MKVSRSGGKTAPRLLQDLILYDPRHLPATGYNILTDLPPQYEEGKTFPIQVGRGSCRHEWVLKHDQSDAPGIEHTPGPFTVYLVAAYCTSCRCHLELSVSFKGKENDIDPCPNEFHPLHHFLYTPRTLNGHPIVKDGVGPAAWSDRQLFQCSSIKCPASLVVQIRSPRLTPDWVAMLTDKDVIKSRAKKAMEEYPERLEGHAVPPSASVLANLRTYIANAWTEQEGRKIQGTNKKWLLSLGEPCADLLQYLGFRRDELDWIPPRPNTAEVKPFKDPLNVLLDDVDKELLVLISQRPYEERQMAKVSYTAVLAMADFEKALGCLDYKKSLASRTIDLTHAEHPFYAGLGATGDFHDDLIGYAYDRQIACDVENTPYYLECLQGIEEGRSSEDLQTKVAIEASSDKISLKDVRGAYRDLGLDGQSENLDDDTIIGTFQSRILDAPKQELEMRRALMVIGQNRSSDKIQFIASKSVTTYEQALTWLGATEDMDDGFLLSMYSVKVDEKPSDEQIARHAVTLVAQKRNSSALRGWLETGILGEIEMDIGYAYNRLGISDRTIDDETILAAYNFHVGEAPSQLNDLRSALKAIAKSKESRFLQSFMNSGMLTSEYSPSEWPAGLQNIGNTCYLNSLLQFYFTVKPLRDLVLGFDEYKMPIEEGNLKMKKVGSRKVSRKEVERAQRFVYELKKLFKSMISTPTAQVTPEQELARLTLVSSTKEDIIRRHSVLSAHHPSLGEVNGLPVFGPSLPSVFQDSEGDPALTGSLSVEPPESPLSRTDINGDASSEDTLVEAAAPEYNDFMMTDPEEKEQQQQILEDKENLPPNKSDLICHSTLENHTVPLEDSSPSRTNVQQHYLNPVDERRKKEQDPALVNGAPPSPNRPPPFPPRPKPEEQKSAMQEEVEIGAQQDVTEVIANVLFQLQCAIKPESFDEDGEQIDQVKRLFFGKQRYNTEDRQGTIRKRDEFISNIIVDVASASRDIYAALDGAFDVQEVEVGGSLEPQYTTISELPPVLQILVQRVQFDPKKKSAFKSTHHLELKETIYMDRYMDSGDASLLERRRECWKWKKDLIDLEAQRAELSTTELGLNIPEVLVSTSASLQQIAEATALDDDPIEVSPALLQCLEMAADEAKRELESIDANIKHLTTNINSQFTDLRNIPYRLQAVFIHRGLVNYGHYWIYIYDFDRKMWRKYNDEYVTEVKDTAEIFEKESTDRPQTPYFLVYVKDDLKNELVTSVCRNIESPTEPQDVVMKDVVEDPGEDLVHNNSISSTSHTTSNQAASHPYGIWTSTGSNTRSGEW